MSVDITPRSKRKPLKINYGEAKFVLPGRVPTEMVTASDAVPRPKVMAGSQKATYEQQVGIAVIAAFLLHVVPDDFRDVLDVEDVGQVFDAWSEHVGWGKAQTSDD